MKDYTPSSGSIYAALIRIDAYEADPDWKAVRELWRSEVGATDFSLVGRRIQLRTRKQAAWTEPWARGQPLTGVARVDALMNQFGFEVAPYRSNSKFPYNTWDLTSREKLRRPDAPGHSVAMTHPRRWRPN